MPLSHYPEPVVELDTNLVDELLASHFPAPGYQSRFFGEGEDFKVFERNGWAWRFPKRAEVECWLLREGQLLELIAPALTVEVPQFIFRGQPSPSYPYAFVGYRLLHGVSADHLDEGPGHGLAKEIGGFLTALHSFPSALAKRLDVPDGSALYSPEACLGRAREAWSAEVSDESLAASCIAFLRSTDVPRRSPDALSLIHGDFEAEHILLDPVSRRMTGVLDWADACLGDPARDFGALWAWGGDGFLESVLTHYNRPRDEDFVIRLKFLGRCFALLDYQEAHTESPAKLMFTFQQLNNVFHSY